MTCTPEFIFKQAFTVRHQEELADEFGELVFSSTIVSGTGYFHSLDQQLLTSEGISTFLEHRLLASPDVDFFPGDQVTVSGVISSGIDVFRVVRVRPTIDLDGVKILNTATLNEVN